jgi:hypothetical protein
MTIAEFWTAQRFSYLVTYSFNRGPKLAALHEDTVVAIAQTKLAMQQAPFRGQQKLESQLRKLQEDIRSSIYNKKLSINALETNSTAERIAVVRQNTLIANQLSDIFRSSTGEAVFFMCSPIYRDAIVFYDEQHAPLAVLNICLECLFMEASNSGVVKADIPTYEALQQLLVQLGHPIESPEVYW